VVELGWKPLQLLSAGSTGRSILEAAGLENAKGIVSIAYGKDIGSPLYAKDPDIVAFEALRAKYLPTVSADNSIAFFGYGQAVSMAEILRRCGDELTHENVLKQAIGLNGFRAPQMLPGVSYSYTNDAYVPMATLYTQRFDGKDWIISDKSVTQ
jgi:hypothetical protein